MALTVKPLDKVRASVPVAEVTKASPEDLVRVNLQVDKGTRMRWHTEALKRDMSLTKLIQQAMEEYIGES